MRLWAWALLLGALLCACVAFGLLELTRCVQEEPLLACLFDKVRFDPNAPLP